MKYDFDKVVPREGTDCEKHDSRERIFGRADVIPLWVADMDFESPPEVVKAIQKRAAHPLYGYSFRSKEYTESIIGWVDRHTGWKLEPEWLCFSPGVVPGLIFGMQAFSCSGEGVVIQPPVYPPFARMTAYNDRTVVNNPLVEVNGRYEIDFDDLDRKLSQARILILSNPHNPTGRVFTPDELRRMGEMCISHDVIILSDEIHSDIMNPSLRHTHIASLSPEIAARTLTFIAPSKTFNLAGLSTSVVICPDPALRRRWRKAFDTIHAEQGNIFGNVALQAAYEYGDEWVRQLNSYLDGNFDYIMDFLRRNIPSIGCYKPEGTYLMWLDFRKWNMPHDDIFRFLVDEAGLGFNDGKYFGEEGLGFMRLNAAAPRSVMEQAMKQLLEACRRHGLDK